MTSALQWLVHGAAATLLMLCAVGGPTGAGAGGEAQQILGEAALDDCNPVRK